MTSSLGEATFVLDLWRGSTPWRKPRERLEETKLELYPLKVSVSDFERRKSLGEIRVVSHQQRMHPSLILRYAK